MALSNDQKIEKALLKQIKAATTIDAVNALLPEVSPSDVVVNAINDRIAEIELSDVDPEELITYTKDGETVQVHSTQVALWIKQGWTAA